MPADPNPMNKQTTPLRSLIVGMGGLSNAMSKFLRQYDWHMLYHAGISSQSDLYEFRLEGERGALRCRDIYMSNDAMHYDFALRGGNFAERAIDADVPLVSPWTIFFEQWRTYMTTDTSTGGALVDGTEPHFTGRNNLKVFAMLSAGIDSINEGRPVAVAGNPRFRRAFA